MRLGFAPSGVRDAATALALARRAETLGFEEVWVSEDYLERGAFAVAGAVAAATERVRIGLGVINPWTRHVALTAMECAALDEVSGGRLVVGLGASNRVWMQDLLGIPFTRPITTLTDYTAALRILLRGERLSREVTGQPVEARLGFVPRRPDVPIYWGVKGPRGLAAGAATADGLMLSVLSAPAYVRWVRQNHAEQGLPLTAYVAFACDEDGDLARARVRSRAARYLGVHGASAITAIPGMPTAQAEALRGRFLAGQDASDLVDDATLATFTVAGTPQECAAGLEAFAAAGLDTLVVMDDGVGAAEAGLTRAAACAQRAGLLG